MTTPTSLVLPPVVGRPVRLRISCYGKDRRWGPDVWKFGHGADLLIRAGWRLRRRPAWSSYSYLSPPPGVPARPAVVETFIPTDDELVALTQALHAAGRLFHGAVLGWPTRYEPARDVVSTYRVSSFDAEGEVVRTVRRQGANFEIGESLVWGVRMCWGDGEAAPTRCGDTLENLIGEGQT
jgi:hypothetical protein